MRLPKIPAAMLLATSTLGILPATTLAQTPTTASVCSNARCVGAPGPVAGAGVVGLAVGGVYGIYRLVMRRRREMGFAARGLAREKSGRLAEPLLPSREL